MNTSDAALFNPVILGTMVIGVLSCLGLWGVLGVLWLLSLRNRQVESPSTAVEKHSTQPVTAPTRNTAWTDSTMNPA